MSQLSAKFLNNKTTHSGVVLWRKERDSNPRYPFRYTGFRVRRIRPLCHLSLDKRIQAAREYRRRAFYSRLSFGDDVCYLSAAWRPEWRALVPAPTQSSSASLAVPASPSARTCVPSTTSTSVRPSRSTVTTPRRTGDDRAAGDLIVRPSTPLPPERRSRFLGMNFTINR